MSKEYVIEESSLVLSSPNTVFKILSDVTRWKEWTESVSNITFVGSNEFKPGAKLKIVQPKLLPAIWTITEISDGESITWEKKSLGLKIVANHILIETDNNTIVKLQIIYSGFFARISYKLSSELTQRYLIKELLGLKEKCEQISRIRIVYP